MKKMIGLMIFAAALIGCIEEEPRSTGTTDGGNTCGLSGIVCVANSHCEGNTCVCNAGFAADGGVCAAVPDGGSAACGLVATCAANSHCENNSCVCNSGFTLVGGVCVAGACGQVASCAANAHCENNTCVCNAGYTLTNGACVPVACGLVTQCAANSHCENNACVCDSGFSLVSGVCTRTDGGTDPSLATRADRVEILRAANNRGFSWAQGNWCLTMWDAGSVRVSGTKVVVNGVESVDCDRVTIPVPSSAGGWYRFTDQRNRSNSDERTYAANQSAACAGYVVRLHYNNGTWRDVQSDVYAVPYTSQIDAKLKYQVAFIAAEQAQFTPRPSNAEVCQ